MPRVLRVNLLMVHEAGRGAVGVDAFVVLRREHEVMV